MKDTMQVSAHLFYLKGFTRLTKPKTTFLAQAAIVSRIAEALQVELMEDSRVAIRYPVLWATVTEEMKWVADLPTSFWVRLASVSDIGACEMKDTCIAAAQKSYQFITEGFWSQLVITLGVSFVATSRLIWQR